MQGALCVPQITYKLLIQFSFLVDTASVPGLLVDITDENTIFNSLLGAGELGSLSVNYADSSKPAGNGGAATITYTITDIAPEGTLTTVPLPAPVWLFVSGLLGLLGIARRKAA